MIETMTDADYAACEILHAGRRKAAESIAAQALQPGEGIKFPCRWIHDPKGSCRGHTLFASRRIGFAVHGTCKGGTFYVWRSPETEE